MNNLPNKITISEIARLLGVTRQAIQRQLQGKISAGDVRVIAEGNKYLIKTSTLPKELISRLESINIESVEKAREIIDKPVKDLHFEKELWAAADKLRGNIDAAEYKHVVLGLLFLKYISDAFYNQRKKIQHLVCEPSNSKYFIPNENAREQFIENKDTYKSEGIFYIPEKARWEFLQAKASQPDIATYIDDAMEAIEQANPEQLRGVLTKSYVRMPLDGVVLGELVNIFSRIIFYGDDEKEKDTLGRVYEYFLGQFADAEGKRGGEFFTPRPIVKLLVEVLEPFENSRVLDPACGSGGMFVQSSTFLKEHHKDPVKIAIFGQENNPTTLKLCKMNLAIRGVFGQIELGNTYYDDKFPDLKADFCLANPPFNAEWDPKRLADNDPRIVFGTPPNKNANFMWIQHFIHHLTPNGMAGFVMANGALAVGGKEGNIREQIIEADLVDVVIACPAKLFYNVSLPVSLWFVTKNKESGRFRNRKRETLFIDAREIFTQISRKQVTFTDEQIQKIANTIRSWRSENHEALYEDIPGFCKATTLNEIVKNGYVLTPGRYVGIPDEVDDGIPFEVKMKQYSSELKALFDQSHELEGKIKDNLQKIGLGI